MVKVDVETVDSLRRRLAVEVPAETVTAEIDQAYAELGRAAKVPGFRPGRVPRPVLERLFGDRVRAEVFGKLIQRSLAEAIEERQLEPVGEPEIVTEEARAGTALRYSATVEVKPDVVAQHYSGLQVERPIAPVTDADVQAAIERLRQSLAQLHPITDRTRVEAQDVVNLDYEARIDSRLVSRAEDRAVEMGANGFPPGFDQQLIGAEVGAELNFPLSYPADYSTAELAGKTVQFRVRVRGISRKEVPLLDDEFAKDHGECSTLDELRERVRRRLEEEAAREADERMRNALLGQLAAAHDIPVPQAMIQRRTAALVDEVLRGWQQQRMRPKNESEALARLRQELEPRAQQQVKIALLLEAIARQENLTVSDEDVEQRIAALATHAGTAAERVRALYQNPEARQQLRTRLVHERVVDLMVAHARIRDVERQSSVDDVAENG